MAPSEYCLIKPLGSVVAKCLISESSRLEKCHKSFRKINHLFPNDTPSKDGEERNEVISKWPVEYDQLLEELNEEFYQYKGALEKALVTYIIQNKLSL